MKYLAVTDASEKMKVGYTLKGILGASLLFVMSRELLSYFLSRLPDHSVLFVSSEGHLYAGSEPEGSLHHRPVTYIITEDAEILWERRVVTATTTRPPDNHVDLPF